MILFVGDRPSSKNSDSDMAFIGTRSYKTLLEWVKNLGISDFNLTNSHEPINIEMIRASSKYFLIITLGRAAAKRLDKAKIPHLSMPHPSGRNRKLNNKEYVERMLWDTKQQIESLLPSLQRVAAYRTQEESKT